MYEKLKDLREEILNDPLGRGYATMTNAQIAADLNAAIYEEVLDDVELDTALVTDTLGLDRAAEIIGNLKTAATNGDVKADLSLDLLHRGVKLSNPTTQTAIDSFVASGLITADEATLLRNRGKRMVSRAQQLGYTEPITEAWVAAAKGG